MNPCIVSEDLVVKHGRSRALDGLSLQVQEGSVTALLGRNGAGKSTLLDCLIGLLPPSCGRLRVLGRDPWKEGPRLRQDIGYVEADPWFEPGDRVRDLLRLHRAIYPRWSAVEAGRLLAAFELDPARKVKQLSRGMRTKLALVLALAHRPKLLVLDEPFDGLDCGARDEILAEVIRQVDDERSIIIASHDLDEIERVADRVVVLHQGKLVFCGELDALRSRTRRFVARIGEDFREESVAGAASIERLGHELKLTFFDEVQLEARDLPGLDDLRPLPTPDLEESFLAATGGRKKKETV